MRTGEPRLPNLIIGGAQKCGTTSLHRIFEASPDIHVPRSPQEIHFYDVDRHFQHGTSWLTRHYRRWTTEAFALNTSPLYLYEPSVPGRIANCAPDTRFVFVLRDPVQRAYSHYWHEVRFGYERLPFAQAIAAEPRRIRQGFEARRHYSYLDRGRYAEQIARYLDHFGPEQILLVETRELSEPRKLIDRCAAHLGIDASSWKRQVGTRCPRYNAARIPTWPGVQRLTRPVRPVLPRLVALVDRLNLRRRDPPPMSPEIETMLRECLQQDTQRLEAMTGLMLMSRESNNGPVGTAAPAGECSGGAP